ncbi:NADH:flavin oxidoreductase/NADH oxidase [Fictibacillus sp. WQ 8-8]|uniref:NADH:flavin oxidoreductase/NADH oxidase n=1 Tax=Fictibacillus sp. WQ 8-8 TaxID=2938788 RepID=UPI00210C992B|nr:NADH:flavin oxidoreductase/NADH oxidase [Fictibacillus sp. WQ 8-8]MCQ6268363.1 NADH:flavin oxidoreductase/NADH oxidase [Fictibacillus sp. WQ 8-8]
MPGLFDPIAIKGLELKNRVMMSSMCQYQAEGLDGAPVDWHFIHYVSRAIGGTGLIVLEMTNIEPRGRITEKCLGLWSQEHIPHYKRIVDACHSYGAKAGIQIAHAGRKSVIEKGDIIGPTALPFSENSPMPRELKKVEIEELIEGFGKSAELAVQAGFDTIELHGAHGYLLHQFFSPASNKREDEYGRYNRFPLEVIKAVKAKMPGDMPLIMRISAVEYREGGYGFNHMLEMIPDFIEAGIDAFDVSTGGDGPVRPKVYPAYQAKYAEIIKNTFHVPVISVGNLETPAVAESVIRSEVADLVAIGRGMLRNPYWVKEASLQIGENIDLPGVYNLGY